MSEYRTVMVYNTLQVRECIEELKDCEDKKVALALLSRANAEPDFIVAESTEGKLIDVEKAKEFFLGSVSEANRYVPSLLDWAIDKRSFYCNQKEFEYDR